MASKRKLGVAGLMVALALLVPSAAVASVPGVTRP
jgi:hypothetical protein